MGQTYPQPITPEMLAPANPDVVKPRYTSMDDWFGGVEGDEVTVAMATATAPFSPVNQGHKAEIIGVSMAVDVTTPRGWIDPHEPYGPAPTPVLTSIDPDTSVVGPPDNIVLHVIGENFLPGSVIVFGNNPLGERTTFVSDTELTTIIKAGNFPNPDPAVPVAVRTADKLSEEATFAFTAEEPEEEPEA